MRPRAGGPSLTAWFRKDAADVILEVTAVQLAPGMTLAERTAGYLHGPRYDVWSVRRKVTAGAFTNEVAHQAQFPALAAEELADDLEVWTQTNRGRLMENRKRR